MLELLVEVEVVLVVRVVGGGVVVVVVGAEVEVVEVEVVPTVLTLVPPTGSKTSCTLMQKRLGSFSGSSKVSYLLGKQKNNNNQIKIAGLKELTRVTRGIISKFVGVLKGRADTDPATGGRVLLPDKLEVDLDGVGLGVAGPGGLEDGARVAALRHEHLDSVVDHGVLPHSRMLEQATVISAARQTGQTYLPTNPGADLAPANGTGEEIQVIRGRADGTNEQMLVTTTRLEQVHVEVVDLRIGGILDLDPEGGGDGVGEGGGWEGASRGECRTTGEQTRN